MQAVHCHHWHILVKHYCQKVQLPDLATLSSTQVSRTGNKWTVSFRSYWAIAEPWYCYECVAWVTKPKVTNEWYVSNIAMYYGDTDFIIQTWNFIAYSSTNGHSKCSLPWFAWWQYFISGFHASMLALQATNTEAGSHEHEAKAEPHRAGSVCTAAVQFIPDGMSSTSTSRSSDNYKPALFMSAKLVSTSSSQPINHHEFAACLMYM